MARGPERAAQQLSASRERGGVPLIEAVNLVVEFGAQRALDRVSFSLRSGEIVGLVGANGAGKSTLGRVLVGEIQHGDFRGELRLKGKEICFFDSQHAHNSGITLIHQEGAAIDKLSVGENVMLMIEPTSRSVINWPALHDAAASGLRQLGTIADTQRPLGEHGGVALIELVEIARSIVRGGNVFVFDESTAALGSEEVSTLLTKMRELAARGAGIVFISHRIDEVLAVCDRVVVLRDGRKVLDAPRTNQDHANVIRAMLGERSDASTASENSRHAKVNDAPRPTALVVRNWRVLKSEVSRVEVGPLDFEARRGEILGVFGPLGAGKTELLHSLYGLAGGLCSGEHWLDGAPMQPFATPVAAIQRGMALVSAERQREGIVPGLSVLENMMLGYRRPGLTRQGMMIRHSEARTLCERLIATLGIMTNGPDQPIESLSGGNQQKVLLARAMVNSPTILLLDEPTRGIDVGAKQDVYRWIRDTATAGAVVVVSSLEEEELIGLADRILVLRDGQKVALLDATRTSAKELLILTAGGPPH